MDKSKYKIVYENNPDLEPVARQPTQKNPDVVVELGKDSSGNTGVRSLEYPADKYSFSQVDKKVAKFKTEKEADCPMCKSVETAPQTESRGGLGLFGNSGGIRDRIGGIGGDVQENRRFPLIPSRPSPIMDRIRNRDRK